MIELYIGQVTTRKGGPFSHEMDKEMRVFDDMHMCQGLGRRSQLVWTQRHPGTVLFLTKCMSKVCVLFCNEL